MIPVAIDTLVVGTPPAPSVIVLHPTSDRKGTGRVLPIWIGPAEAASIGMSIQGDSPQRPMTHDLLGSLLDIADAELGFVVINNVVDTTFFATVVFEQNDESKNVDARPSDAIALAVRSNVPIYVEEEVLDLASFPAAFSVGNNTDSIEVEEFHDFIESVNPDDFSA